jgi:hypothetical protein
MQVCCDGCEVAVEEHARVLYLGRGERSVMQCTHAKQVYL